MGWSDLLRDLLVLIFKPSSMVDFIHQVKAVCLSWKARISSLSNKKPLKTPWLMLPPEDKNAIDCLRFFNLEDKKVYELNNMPKELHVSRCVGSSHGWLVLLDERAMPYLLNPFTRARVQLPFLDTLPKVVKREDGKEYQLVYSPDKSVVMSAKELREEFIGKAILCTETDQFQSNSINNYGVALIYDKKRVAFCKCGDLKWTDLGGEHYYCDIIYHHNQLYAVSCIGTIDVWDLRNFSPMKKMEIQPCYSPKILETKRSFNNCNINWYLAQSSSGDLLFVQRFLVYDQDEVDYKTKLFYVYKLDFEEKVWVEVESLGNQVLFLGGNHSMSLLARDFPGCDENSIYFTDDNWAEMKESFLYGGHDMGVYNFEDTSIMPFYQCGLGRIQPPPFWVVPRVAET